VDQIDWDDLKLALAVARGGGLSGAARLLGLNHATVFRRLNALEKSLGVRLFERFRDGYTATPAGERVVAMAERVEAEVIEASRVLSGQDMRPEGQVRITTTDALMALIAQCLPALHAANPMITLELIISNAMVSLGRRDADLALRATQTPPPELFGRKVGTFAYGIYAAGPLAEKASAGKKSDLAALPWVAPDETVSHTPSARWMGEHVKAAPIGGRGNSLPAILEMARAGMGLALLPCLLADPLDDLHRVGTETPMALSLWVLTHNDLRNVARVRATMTVLADAILAQQPLLSGTVEAKRGGTRRPAPRRQ
jgi:DNA-binding transcriptional LysR family regulator